MKTLFAAILVALSVSTSTGSFAAAKPINIKQTETGIPASVTFAQVEKSKLDVIAEKVANAPMSIRLTDATGKTIATKTLSQRETATRVRFDLANLADGVYHVKVRDGQNTQVQKFELKTATPSLTTYQDLAIL
jgi:hypothetical protein